MASKRMSISALLSSDSKPPSHSDPGNSQLSNYPSHHSYHPDNEPMRDVDIFHKRSRESISTESHLSSSYSNSTSSNTFSASWYHPTNENRTPPITHEPRSVQRQGQSYPPLQERPQYQSENEHARYSSSPSYSDRYPERQQLVDSKPTLVQTLPSYPKRDSPHLTSRSYTNEYRERDSRQSPAPSSHTRNLSLTDTGDSLLSVLTRTAASEGVSMGPGQHRNLSSTNFSSSPTLHPPPTLRRDRDKDIERDRIQSERKREVTHPPQTPREYQRSPFSHSEMHSFPSYYHSDIPRSPEMQVLRARPDPHGTPIHPTSATHYVPPPQSPSRPLPMHNTVVTHYHQVHSLETQMQPPSSHTLHTQHRSQTQKPNSPLSKPTSRPIAMPPRLDLTLPLSLSPATISGQLVSPISPQGHPRSSAPIVGIQVQSRSTPYSHTTSPVTTRGLTQDKEWATPQIHPVGKPSSSTAFLSHRNHVPQAVQSHRLSTTHPTSALDITSHQPHSPSFVLPLRPLSPQHQGSRHVSGPLSASAIEPVGHSWEKDPRLFRNPATYHSINNPDMEISRRNAERNAIMSKRPISYDQRRVDQSRMSIAEVMSERTEPGHPTTPNAPHSQEKSSTSLNDRGFRLWTNGPVIEDASPQQRRDVDTRHPTVKPETKFDGGSKVNRSHREESLAHFSPLPLKTLSVPNVDRQRFKSSNPNAETQERPTPCAPNQTKDEGHTDDPPTGASPHPLSPPRFRINILNPEQPFSRHQDAYITTRNETSPRVYVQAISPESKERASVSRSPVMESAAPPRSPEVGMKDDKSPFQVDDRSRAASPPRSDRTASPSAHLNKSSRSPHLSAADTMSSTKTSEIELYHPSPRQPLSPASPGDVPVLYDSIQYPLPLPTGDKTPSQDAQKDLTKVPGSGRSPIPADNELTERPFSPAEPIQPAVSPPKPLSPEDPATVRAADVDPSPSPKEPLLMISVEPTDSSMKDAIEAPTDAISEVPPSLSEERPDYPTEPTVEDEPSVNLSQLEKINFVDNSSNELSGEVVDLPIEDVKTQPSPSPEVALPTQSPLGREKEEVALQGIQSLEKSSMLLLSPQPLEDTLPSPMHDYELPLTSQEQVQQSDQSSIHNAEEPVPEALLTSPVPVFEQPSEEVRIKEDVLIRDVKVAGTFAVETSLDNSIVSSKAALVSKEVVLSEVPGQQLDVATSALEKVKIKDEEMKKADVMDVDLSPHVGLPAGTQQDDQSLEDELLSLVDDMHPKPDIKAKVTAESTPSPAVPSPTSRKAPGSVTKNKPPRPRAQGKPTKQKNIRPDSEAPSSPISGNPPVSGYSSKIPNRPNKSGSGSRKKSANASLTVRSISVMPEPTPEPTPASAEEKLYCICCTPYDEDKVMIACDRCDEWYHPGCVHLPDQEIDLIDQFICEKCKRRSPGLKTTYKTRCYRGTQHIPDYDKNPPCWKAVRGIFSKYCSDTCGIAHMRAKIARSGKEPNELWPLVRHAKKREGVAVEYLYDGSNVAKRIKLETGDDVEPNERKLARPSPNGTKTNALHTQIRPWTNGDRIRLAALKQNIAAIRTCKDRFKLELEYVTTRRRLLDLAVERASEKFCGWDTRLEMGDHEWAKWIISMEGKKALYGNPDEEGEEDDDAEGRKLAWLCYGPVECPRHHGWKTVRDLELQMEVDSKNGSIKQLSEMDRELKTKIEDMDPTSRSDRKVKRKVH